MVVEAEVIDAPVTVADGGGELNLTKKEIKEELAYQKQLVEELKNADDNEEKIVKEYLAGNDNAIANKIDNSEETPE
ncbi:hypothetical protein AABM08_11155, partial [Listeria ivanovii]